MLAFLVVADMHDTLRKMLRAPVFLDVIRPPFESKTSLMPAVLHVLAFAVLVVGSRRR